MSDSSRERELAALVHAARQGPGGDSGALGARIRAYELQYEMSSPEMKERVAGGRMKETADIAKWLFLLGVRETGVTR